MTFSEYCDHIAADDSDWIIQHGVQAFAELPECQYNYMQKNSNVLQLYCSCVTYIIDNMNIYANELVNIEFAKIIMINLQRQQHDVLEHAMYWLLHIDVKYLVKYFEAYNLLMLELPIGYWAQRVRLVYKLLKHITVQRKCQLLHFLISPKGPLTVLSAEYITMKCVGLIVMYCGDIGSDYTKMICDTVNIIHDKRAILELLKWIKVLNRVHYEIVFLVLTPRILDQYICPSEFGRFNIIIQQRALNLVELCFMQEPMYTYPWERKGLFHIRTALQIAICRHPYAIPRLLDVYRMTTNMMVECPEENYGFLIRLIKYATDPYLVVLTRRLFMAYFVNQVNFTSTALRITESGIVQRMFKLDCCKSNSNIRRLHELVQERNSSIRQGNIINVNTEDIFTLLSSEALTHIRKTMDSSNEATIITMCNALTVVMRIIEPRDSLSMKDYMTSMKAPIDITIRIPSETISYRIPPYHTLYDTSLIFLQPLIDTIDYKIPEYLYDIELESSARLVHRLKGTGSRLSVEFECGEERLTGNEYLGDLIGLHENITIDAVIESNPYDYKHCIFNIVNPETVGFENNVDLLTSLSADVLQVFKKVEEIYNKKILMDLSAEMRLRLTHFEEFMNPQSAALKFVHEFPQWFNVEVRWYVFVARSFPLQLKYNLFTTKLLFTKHHKFSENVPVCIDNIHNYAAYVNYLTQLCKNNILHEYCNQNGEPVHAVHFLVCKIWDCLIPQWTEHGQLPNVSLSQDHLELLGILLGRVLMSAYTYGHHPLSKTFFAEIRKHSNTDKYARLAEGFDLTIMGYVCVDELHLKGFKSLLRLFSDQEISELFRNH
jgi:hypothetical protein